MTYTTWNVYSCGCTARSVPILSRCKDHDGMVVAVHDEIVGDDVATTYRTPDKNLTLVHSSLIAGMKKIKDERAGLVLTYPSHVAFAARDNIVTTSFCDFPDKYFPECYRILKDDGHVVLIVESFILSSVLYCASMAGFKVNSVSLVAMTLMDEPMAAKFIREWYYYKHCVVLSKHGDGYTLGNFKMKATTNIAKKFNPSGVVVDTSCIHWPFALQSAKTHKTIGIVSNPRRYTNIVDRAKSRFCKTVNE